MGGGPNQQQQSSDQYYQQEANQANKLFQQYMQYFLPIAQQEIPLLQNTVNGQNTSLTQAAMAPVNAATSRSLNTMQNNIGGYTNADALASDIALNGQQNAGLAADNLISGSLTQLLNLFGMGQSGVGMGMSGLNNAAGGEANLGGQLWNQNIAWWQDALGAAGEAYGMQTGKNTNQPTAQTNTQNPIVPSSFNGPSSASASLAGNPYGFFGASNAQPGVSLNDAGGSTPISSQGPHSGLPGFGP